mmetsp:Transcript_21420/g.30799  ORF Transcript_21420/g.30799 Transcript_21420/m.30799 type:complete len:220 (-) Transcript_21420:39-698(-)
MGALFTPSLLSSQFEKISFAVTITESHNPIKLSVCAVDAASPGLAPNTLIVGLFTDTTKKLSRIDWGSPSKPPAAFAQVWRDRRFTKLKYSDVSIEPSPFSSEINMEIKHCWGVGSEMKVLPCCWRVEIVEVVVVVLDLSFSPIALPLKRIRISYTSPVLDEASVNVVADRSRRLLLPPSMRLSVRMVAITIVFVFSLTVERKVDCFVFQNRIAVRNRR